jgi:hypothetical protein
MFKQVNVPILGIVENMAGYAIEGVVEGARPGQRLRLSSASPLLGAEDVVLPLDVEGRFATVVDVFGTGGAEKLAKKHGFPILGTIPLNPIVRAGGDAGEPIVVGNPRALVAQRFHEIAGRVAQRVAIQAHRSLPVLQ